MPSYKYQCLSGCKESFNKILKIADRNLPVSEPCPSCKAEGAIEKICESPMTVDPFRCSSTQSSKLPGEMKEIYKRMSKTIPGCTLDSRC